jgi:two-component system NtrC family sensor kinase
MTMNLSISTRNSQSATNIFAKGLASDSSPSEQAAEMALLYEAGQYLTSTLDVDEVLSRLMSSIRGTLGVEAASAILTTDGGKELVFAAAAGPGAEVLRGFHFPMGRGIVGWVTHYGETVVVPDVTQDPRFYAGVDRHTRFKTTSVLCVPLKLQGRIIGALEALNKTADAFTSTDVRMLELLAPMAAIAIDNARHYRTKQRRIRELEALNRVSLVAWQTLDLKALLENVLEATLQVMAGDGGLLHLWQLESQTLELQVHRGLTPQFLAHRAEVERRLAVQVARSGKPQLITVQTNGLDSLSPFQSLLIAPLRTRHRLLGALSVLSQRADRFVPDDLLLIAAIAERIALAVEHTRLYAELQTFKELAEQSQDGVIVTDPEGQLCYANQTASSLLSCEPLTMMPGNRLADCLPPQSADSFLHVILPQLKARGQWTGEWELAGREDCGAWRESTPLLVSATVLQDAQERSVGLGLILHDLTEQKHLYQQLLQSEKLSALGEMVAGIAHEMNNSLTSIAGYTHLLLTERVSKSIRRDLTRIQEEARRASRIIQRLLDFARGRPPEMTATDVNESIRQALELCIHDLKQNHICTVMELADDLPLIQADVHQLQQVWLNLINNAEQAIARTRVGGEIVLRSRHQGDGLRVEVADDGPGIPASLLHRVFDPFFTTKPPGEGTGLGLSVSHRIVTEHGGRIWAESQSGKGTTFVVELPIRAAPTDSRA